MSYQVIILAGQLTKDEIIARQAASGIEYIMVDSLRALLMMEGDAYFDLQFNDSQERITELRKLIGKPLFVSSMEIPCSMLGQGFIRINAWPGMLSRPIVELAAGDSSSEATAMDVMNKLGWQARLVPDIPGFISARILATIINEAYFTFEAGVSSHEEIDIAMKLGTNYPEGPFKWAAKIGEENVMKLLRTMSVYDNRYEPCSSLTHRYPTSKPGL